MSFKKFFILNCLIFLPLWAGEAFYSCSHMNFSGQEGSFPACAAIVYISIIPSFWYFWKALTRPNISVMKLGSALTVALSLPIVVYLIGIFVAGNFGWLGS